MTFHHVFPISTPLTCHAMKGPKVFSEGKPVPLVLSVSSS